MEVDKRKTTILILVTAVPALVGGPIFLLMVLGRTVFGHRRGGRGTDDSGINARISVFQFQPERAKQAEFWLCLAL